MPISLRGVFTIALACIASAQASSCPVVRSEGEPVGQIETINGTQIYHTYPSNYSSSQNTTNKAAILYVSDIYGLPLLENKLLADSLSHALNIPVLLPDLFANDAVPVTSPEGPGLNLTEWRTRHPTPEIDAIIAKTIAYIHSTLAIPRIGAVGYCFGGKYVPRFLISSNETQGVGVDVGFIAHPSGLETSEIQAINGPISIAAGQLDAAFNATARRTAEDILSAKGAIFETTLYSQAPHGFAVRANMTVPAQRFAKEASFLQAVGWFGAWL